MANELEKAITIKSAIDKIDSGEFLLPSIQRRFVWNTRQIEFLFDSVMQNYPINTFMFWEVEDDAIKNKFRFYDFLKKYIEYKGGNNEERKTKGYKNFKAVIDGQQRLNSLYIGLKGSFAYKNRIYHKKKYHQDESNYPTRKLFLDLISPIEEDDEKKVYDFRFLICNEHKKENEIRYKQVIDKDETSRQDKCFWFEVGVILEFKNEPNVIKYLIDENLEINGFPGETLLKLYKLVNEKPLVNYFLESEQDFDKILYEFIRTNSGGTKLSFADLLMSIITASWETGQSSKSAREQIDNIVKEIREYGFDIDQDFILKTCLVLISNDIRFALKNFDTNTIDLIREKWGIITHCIKASFELIKSFSFNNYSLRAKNSVIPIIYYLYLTNSFNEINKENKHKENKELIKQYLNIALLNKLFGGSSDGFLNRIKKVILDNQQNEFPLNKLKEEFKGTNRSFNINDEKLDNILRISYDNLDSFYILSILFPKFNFEFKNPNVDHLFPKSAFSAMNYSSLDKEQVEFYNNHYNTVLNLSLLSEEQNKSKNKSHLKPWIEDQEKHNTNIRNTLLIPEEVELDFENFREFIERREIKLKEIIKSNIL